jgi:hypothetical protein
VPVECIKRGRDPQYEHLRNSSSALMSLLVCTARACSSMFTVSGSINTTSGSSTPCLHSTLFYSTLLYSNLPYPILLYSTLLYPTLLYPTLFYSTLLYSTLPYSVLFYPTLLYSIILYFVIPQHSSLLVAGAPCPQHIGVGAAVHWSVRTGERTR